MGEMRNEKSDFDFYTKESQRVIRFNAGVGWVSGTAKWRARSATLRFA